ncbi:helix-turn-helix transcriptional regulator [Campylobacter sp. 19-13652]|uniref:helix-turn-helix transcriptional regulator n=1 Tax=Campylobacter sp. 19-13652 TaxID=2840180 RepID=UPI001C75099A|nr:helix-turn-helix transcriptional regulator [Campylobacter sp. 19-13652]BCX79840.1 hypothetical protein LBC_13020 [Campylobacter sp. 19-13652]
MFNNIPPIINKEQEDRFFMMICANVKRLRLERGLSQLEVALSIGQRSSGFYANTENYAHGKHFNLSHLFRLSMLFGVEIDEFFKPIEIENYFDVAKFQNSWHA